MMKEIAVFLAVVLAFLMGWIGMYNAEIKPVIDLCESELPRNKHCVLIAIPEEQQ